MVSGSFTVQLIRKTVVKASNLINTQPYILPVSNLDHPLDGLPVFFFYVYPSSEVDFPSVVNTITASLAKVLDHFFPFSGQIVHSSIGGARNGSEPMILCNNEGVGLVEASANISLAELNFYSLSQTISRLLLPTDDDRKFPLSVQVTSYTCGGFSISWAFDHLLADVSGFVKFLSAWCEIACTKRLSKVFNHDRRRVFSPRSPPTYGQLVDRTYSVATMDNILNNTPFSFTTKKHLYLVKGSTLETLRQEAAPNRDGLKRSRTVALSAYLWKLMAGTFKGVSGYGGPNESEYAKCKIGLVVEGRQRIDRDSKSISNYIGNVISMAVAEKSTKNLKEGSLAEVARTVSRAIDDVANSAHFLDLIDWVECHRPRKMLPDVLLSNEAPAIIVSSCHNMPVMDMDFGFGLPCLGFICPPVDMMGPCYVTLVLSGRGDGSWFVSACVSLDLATAIELDPACVLEPISADHFLVKS